MERYYFEVRQEYSKDSWFICVYSDRDFNNFIGKWLHSDGEISSKVIDKLWHKSKEDAERAANSYYTKIYLGGE